MVSVLIMYETKQTNLRQNSAFLSIPSLGFKLIKVTSTVLNLIKSNYHSKATVLAAIYRIRCMKRSIFFCQIIRVKANVADF